MRCATACAAALILMGTPALAGLEICNNTGQEQSVAIAHLVDGVWTSEGWWNIAADDCADPVTGPLQNRYYYYRAEIPNGVFKGDGYTFCISDQVFTIAGQDGCEARGYESAGFNVIDTGETATQFKLTLVPPEELNAPPAGKADSHAAETPDAPVAGGITPRSATSTQRWDSGYIQGTFGDPVTQVAMFQGCETFSGEGVCAFFAEGWKWVALYGGPTPTAFLDQIDGLVQGATVEIEGDVLSLGDITVEVALSAVTLRPGALPYEQEAALVQGGWISEDDANYLIEFVGGELYESYDGTLTDVFYWRFAQTCDAAPPGAGFALIKTVPETRDQECLLPEVITVDRLEFINPGRGNLLRFRRP